MSCLLTQQMSCLQTQQMSCLQTQKRCVLGWGGWFWTPFSEKMCQNHCILQGLGAGEGAEPDEADEADEADEPEMRHNWQFRP